mgnify:CR=1 FL=1
MAEQTLLEAAQNVYDIWRADELLPWSVMYHLKTALETIAAQPPATPPGGQAEAGLVALFKRIFPITLRCSDWQDSDGMTGEGCGYFVAVDEDGLCVTCGNGVDAVETGIALAALDAGAEAQRAEETA